MLQSSFDSAWRSTESWWAKVISHPAFVPAVILLGMTIRLLVATTLPIEPTSDSAWYVERAKELANGLGYQEGGHPTAYWPVGWPAILAGAFYIFDSISVAVITLNLTASLSIMLLIPWFGRNLARSILVGRAALLLYALYPNHIAYVGNAATELVYTAVAMGAFALMIYGRSRPWLLLICGLVFGVATLIKPQTIAFPFGSAIALAIVFKRFTWWSALRAAIIVYLGLLLVVLPWTYRNYTVFGEPVLVSTNGGVALLLGANPQMTGGHFELQRTEVFAQLGIPWEDRVARQVELNNKQKEAGSRWIRKNKAEYIAWMPKKVLQLWLSDNDGFWSYEHSYPGALRTIFWIKIFNQAFYVVILFLSFGCFIYAALGILRTDESLKPIGLLFCMPMLVSLLAAVFTGQIRYHFPAMPYLVIAAVWMLMKILKSSGLVRLPESDRELEPTD